MTTYRYEKRKYCTRVYEYWDNIHMKTYDVYQDYNGGNIEEFLNNNAKCMVYFNYNNQLSLF